MHRNTIYNEYDERMFDVLSGEDEEPLVEIKVGKGRHAYRYMNAEKVIERISNVIKDKR